MYATSIIIPISVIAKNKIGLPSYTDKVALIVIFVAAIIGILSRGIRRKVHRKKTVHVFIVLMCLAFVQNMIFALEKFDALSRWALLFSVVFVYGYFVIASSWDYITKMIPVFAASLLISSVLGRLLTLETIGVGSAINQSIGLYAGSALILSLAYQRRTNVVGGILISSLILITTGARGSLISLIIAILPAIYVILENRKIVILLLAPLLFLVAFFGTIFEEMFFGFARYKVDFGHSAFENILYEWEKRLFLAFEGLQLSLERPMGFGLGDGYVEVLGISSKQYTMYNSGLSFQTFDSSTLFHVHNGIVSTILELGWLVGGVTIGFVFFGIWRIYRSECFSRNQKAAIVGFCTYMVSRSFSDNYFVTNGANVATYVFDILIIVAFVRPEIHWKGASTRFLRFKAEQTFYRNGYSQVGRPRG